MISAEDEVRQVRFCRLFPCQLGLTIGRELEEDLVPEWRAKYIDYKV